MTDDTSRPLLLESAIKNQDILRLVSFSNITAIKVWRIMLLSELLDAANDAKVNLIIALLVLLCVVP